MAADAAVFLGGAALQYVAIYGAMPMLTASGVEPIAAWMLVSVPLVFAPVILWGGWLLHRERNGADWRTRLRLRRPSGRDVAWAIGGWACIAATSGAAFLLCAALGLDPYPPFSRAVEPIGEGRRWLFVLWAVYWPFNMLGEEFVWRGVLLPRMEAYLGARAWVFNAVLWGVFHAAFGLGNAIVLLPTLLIVPWLAQARRSTWVALFLHAGLSLPGFVALSQGW